jgi:hypothetical protein
MDSDDAGSAPALAAAKQQIVNFYGDQIPGAFVEGTGWYIPLRPLTDFMGLNFSGQRQRVMRDEVLAEQVRTITLAGADGRKRDLLCLPLESLPGWLFGLTPGKTVTDELKAKIRRYRAECFRVLWEAFKSDILPSTPPAPGLSLAEQAVDQARALLHLAEQQLDFERRLTAQGQQQQAMADFMRPFVRDTRQQLTGLDERVSSLELQLSAGATIDQVQQAELQLAVKAVAAALEEKGKANGYQRVYGELYRRYGISGYKQLPRARFDHAMAWLRAWYAELGGTT